MLSLKVKDAVYELLNKHIKQVNRRLLGNPSPTNSEMRQVFVYPGEDGYWVVECPGLPGCISQGKTKTEALVNIKEAIEGYLAALEEDHREPSFDRPASV